MPDQYLESPDFLKPNGCSYTLSEDQFFLPLSQDRPKFYYAFYLDGSTLIWVEDCELKTLDGTRFSFSETKRPYSFSIKSIHNDRLLIKIEFFPKTYTVFTQIPDLLYFIPILDGSSGVVIKSMPKDNLAFDAMLR